MYKITVQAYIKKNLTSIYYQSGTMTKMNYKSIKRNNSAFFLPLQILFPFLVLRKRKLKYLRYSETFIYICI